MKITKEDLLKAVEAIPDTAFDQTEKITVSIDATSIEVKYEPPIEVIAGGGQAGYGYSRVPWEPR